MRYRLFLSLALLVCLAVPVSAQGPTGLKTLRIALWPEFDDPRLLVIIDGELSQTGQSVRIPLPAQAEVNAVASTSSDGNLVNAEFETTAGADGATVISFKPAQTGFRVEYYVPLVTKGDQRISDFNLPSGFVDAAQVDIEALLPPSATNFSSVPAMQSSSTSDNGGQVFVRALGAAAAGAAIEQNLTYDNTTGAMGVPEGARATQAPAAATPVAAPAPAATGGSSSRTLLIVLLGILAVALVGIGLFGLWRTRQRPAEPAVVAPPRKPESSKPVGTTAAGNDRFCRQCGTEFRRDDRFCRECGEPRR